MQSANKILVLFREHLRSALASSLVFTSLIPTSLILGLSAPASAQNPAPPPLTDQGSVAPPAPVVPQQVRYTGKLTNRPGDTVEAVFRIYAAPEGGDPLWTETQQLTTAEDGSYSVLLGAASPIGLPQSVFAGGEARWLGITLDRSPEQQDRVLLSSVPYAMKSADAESLSGHAASDFVTQAQLAQLTLSSPQPAAASPEIQPNTSGTVTGSGTAGTLPLWTGAFTQGNSEITQTTSGIGINQSAPTATLDVNGTENVRGVLDLPPVATATASVGQRSQLLQLTSSAWSTSAKAAVNPTFKILTNFLNNNTAAPQGQLEFHYQNGTASVNVFTIASTGVLTFAPTQTFPGTIASITAGTGITSSTSGNKVTLSINPNVVPTLSGNNTFPGNTIMTSTNSQPALYAENEGTGGGTGIFGYSTFGSGMEGAAFRSNPGDTGVFGSLYTETATWSSLAPTWAAGVWGDAQTGNGSVSNIAGIIGTADNTYAGVFENNSTMGLPALDAVSNGPSSAILGEAQGQGGSGVVGYSQTGDGMYGNSIGGNAGVAGVFGEDYLESFTYNTLFTKWSAGVWGDASNYGAGAPNYAGVLGSNDDGTAGYFVNDSSTSSTLALVNNGSGGTGLYSALMASTPNGTCGIGDQGNLSCTGQVKSLVSVDNGAHKVETYAPQSAESWMEDYGTGVMERGVALVKIDPAFAKTISETPDYHIFLTPNADSESLYVINKTATSFEVHEAKGGTSSLTFDFKIVAKRRGFEAQRLVDVTDRFNDAQKRISPSTSPKTASPTHHSQPVLPPQSKISASR